MFVVIKLKFYNNIFVDVVELEIKFCEVKGFFNCFVLI